MGHREDVEVWSRQPARVGDLRRKSFDWPSGDWEIDYIWKLSKEIDV